MNVSEELQQAEMNAMYSAIATDYGIRPDDTKGGQA
jgi:hypothetical protein